MPQISGRTQQKKKKSARSTRRAPRGTRSGEPSEVLHLARLIADPCSAPLVAPQYGASDGGYLAKFSSYEAQAVGTVATSGYAIWFPDFCGRVASEGNQGNLFMYGTTNVNTPPTNTAALPLGVGASADAVNGQFQNDPAWDFCNSSTVQDCRTVAACMKMLYTGRNDSLAGRVGYLENIPREALITGNAGSPPSPADLFRYSNKTTRTPMDPCEEKFKPGQGSDYYRAPQVDTGTLLNGLDYAFVQGETGVSQTTVGLGSSTGVGHGIGFVWNGLANNTSLSFDFLKAVEWRPEISTGIVVPTATTSRRGENIVTKAVSYLDNRHAGWETRAFSAITSGAARIAQAAFQGPMAEFVKDTAPLLLTML